MTLRLIREPSAGGTTLGVLFLDGRFRAFSLEDEIREEPGVPVARWKIPGETAIPAGRYPVAYTWSNRFQRLTPELRGVPGFTGIRIHRGNRAADTSGCILLGVRRSGVVLEQSAQAVADVEADIKASLALEQPVWMLIENPLV